MTHTASSTSLNSPSAVTPTREQSFARLLRIYRDTGFIDPMKRKTIDNYISDIGRAWNSALGDPDPILVAYVCEDIHGHCATASHFRASNRSLICQHLASRTSPVATGEVLSTLLHAADDLPWCDMQQVFYQSAKPIPQRIFGGLLGKCGRDDAAILHWWMYHFPSTEPPGLPNRITVAGVIQADAGHVAGIVRHSAPSVYIDAIDLSDIEQQHTADAYHGKGLPYKRRIFAAVDRVTAKVVAFAICYIGPPGLNFSFLENRVELLLEEHTACTAPDLTYMMSGTIAPLYRHLPFEYIPVLANKEIPSWTQRYTLFREYSHLIFTRSARHAAIRHIEDEYGIDTAVTQNSVDLK